MAQSLAKIHTHLIFSTKNRRPFIHELYQPKLHSYLKGACDNQKCFAGKVGGVEDHVHILFELHRTVSLSNLVGEVKAESSKWFKKTYDCPEFQWQAGYGAFSISESNREQVRDYIEGQRTHHQKKTFQEEFREFLTKYHVDFDEKYVWD